MIIKITIKRLQENEEELDELVKNRNLTLDDILQRV